MKKKRKKESSRESTADTPPLKKKKEIKREKEKIEPSSEKKQKKKKDPNQPKKNWTSYMFFTNAKRAEIKEKNPDASFGDLSKLVGAAFKKLSDEERKRYNEMADKDKARYKGEMKDYNPPTDDDDDSSKKKKVKGPKKNLSAYNYYFSAIRNDVVKDNPDASFGGLSTIISGMFKKLTKEERKKYDEQANKDKARYEEAKGRFDKEMEKDGKGGKTVKKKVKKDPNAPKKNLTSYMLFAQASREEIKNKNPDATFGELGKLMGEEFKKLSPDNRKKWDERAESDKQRYKREIKDYEAQKKAMETDTEEDSASDSDNASGKGGSSSDANSDSDDKSDDTDDDTDDDSE